MTSISTEGDLPIHEYWVARDGVLVVAITENTPLSHREVADAVVAVLEYDRAPR